MYDGDLNLSELPPGFVQNYADEFDRRSSFAHRRSARC